EQIIPLRAVADVHESSGPSVIHRENAQRRVLVTANSRGGDWPSLVEQLQSGIRENVKLPPGAFIRVEGEFEAQRAATQRILLLSAAVVLVLAMLLHGYFRSGVLAAQVLLNIPFALLGGLILTWLVIGSISIATLI